MKFVLSRVSRGGREKGMEEGLCDSFRYSIVIQLSVLSPDDHLSDRQSLDIVQIILSSFLETRIRL